MSSTSHPTPHTKTKYEWVSDMFQFSKPKILKTKKKKASAPAIFNTEPAPNPGQLSVKSSQESTHSTTTIQSISKPTDFEHGIHIEYNDQSGRFMGVPDVWKQTLPYDDLLNTQYIDPLLVPTTPQYKFQPGASCPTISTPYNLKHNMNIHVDEIGNTSAVGIPPEWVPLFAQSGLNLEDIRNQPELFENIFNPKTGSLTAKSFSNMVSSGRFGSLFAKRNTTAGVLQANMINNFGLSIDTPNDLEKDSPSSYLSHLSGPTTPASREQDLLSPSLPDIELSGPILLGDVNKEILEEYELTEYINLSINPDFRFIEMNTIAEGESGDVHTAFDSQFNNSVVAIKVINFTQHQKLKTLKNELEAMRSCNHPNLVSLLGCYSTCDSLWMTMECMDLGSLCDIVSCYPTVQMSESHIARFSYDILCGLAFLEGCHRIHRDLNSDNILLNSRGHIKIADFNRCVVATLPGVKRTSCMISTHWMAPEVAKMQHYDWRADVWSFGMLLMEMAEGTSPFVDYPAVQFINVISKAQQPKLQQPSAWTDKFLDFFKQTVEPNAENRELAGNLLDHSFLNYKCSSSDVVSLYEQCRVLLDE